MRRVIGLLAIVVTATLMFLTSNISEFMMIVYLLILYLGNSYLISYRSNNDLVPALTCTEFFYIFDFYLLINHHSGANTFAMLAVLFSALLIVCYMKEKKTDLPVVEYEDEDKKLLTFRKISLVMLFIALIFNVILLSLIDFSKINYIYEIVMLVMTLLLTIIIICEGYLISDKKQVSKDSLLASTMSLNINSFSYDSVNDKRYQGRVVSNRPYFILSLFYFLFLPAVLDAATPLLFWLYIAFYVYLLVVMYYPLAKSEYYSFRRNDKKYRFSWLNYLKKSFIYNLIFLLCGLTLSLSVYYVYNKPLRKEVKVNHDASIAFTEDDKETIEKEIRNRFDDVIYLGYEENNNEYSDNDVDKYKKMTIYAYGENDSEVYIYVYYKYTTDTKEHHEGSLELKAAYVSPVMTKDSLDTSNIKPF